MKFIVLPLIDAQFIFTEEELAHMRQNIDGTEVIVHEEILIDKRESMGLATLPSEDTGQIEWTYPNYEYNSEELNNLLESDKWMNKEDTISIDVIDFVSPMKIENGKYYKENGVIYKCIQTSKLSISNKLADLVGYYVEIYQ